MDIIEKHTGDFLISTDREKMDIVAVHDFLSTKSGWSDNIPLERVGASISNSLNTGPRLKLIYTELTCGSAGLMVNSFPSFESFHLLWRCARRTAD